MLLLRAVETDDSPSLFHMSVVIINWHTAGEIED